MVNKSMQRSLHLGVLLALAYLSACSSAPSKVQQPEEVSPEPQANEQQIEQTLNSMSAAEREAYRKAIVLLQQGKPAQAEKPLKKLAKQNSPADINANLAYAYYQLSRFDDAAEEVQKAIEKDGSSPEYHNLAAQIDIERGRFQQAEAALKRALSINNEYALAHYNIALLFDIYYQEIGKAYAHYLKYLNLINYEDKETVQWVEQLRYSVEANQ